MCLKSIKLVTFDVTNTLLQFRVPPWQYYAFVAQNHGFTGTPSDLKPRFLKSFKTMKEHPNFGRDSIKWEEWWRKFVKITFQNQLPGNADLDSLASTLIDDFSTAKCWSRTEGGDSLIKLLRERNISIGLISNTDPRLYDVLQNVSIKDDFDFIVTSYDVGFMKPDCRIFEHAISLCKQNVEPSEALHIGDDIEKDYFGARAAGWHAVLVAENIKTETPPAREHVFKSIVEFTQAIKSHKFKL